MILILVHLVLLFAPVFTYADALAYLEHFTNAEPQPSSPQSMDQTLHLERVTRLLDGLGNPHQRYPVVHVAGTKGKGSVSAICASVLRAAGYRVEGLQGLPIYKADVQNN